MRWIVSLTIISGGSTFAVVAWPYIQPIAQNRNLWAFATVIGILVFTSGHMFNQIRKVPYVAGDGRGGISYFAGGFQNQYGLESQIVGAMCMCAVCPFQYLELTSNRWRSSLSIDCTYHEGSSYRGS